MTIFRNNSLSGYITQAMVLIGALLLLLSGALMMEWGWRGWDMLVVLLVISTAIGVFIWRFKHRLLTSFDRALLHVEAVKVEDYNQFSKADFDTGVTAELHAELSALSKQLQAHKSQYDQHALLLYQLIDQLDTPMLVFNQRMVLTYANGAFSLLYGEPWQVYRRASPRLLGLEQVNGEWKINQKDHNWQINQSEFIDSGERHLLLVFTNIDSALRASQIRAWQQITRVLGHEIRNSLTPVSSLAESLSAKTDIPRDRQALETISERCLHLQDFVERYASLAQDLNLDVQNIDVEGFTRQLRTLFPDHQLHFTQQTKTLKADPTFIQQVFINLIKNALEAGANEVNVSFKQKHDTTVIRVSDDGHGISNPDNLFVPLYTTKREGQGIGLAFCRNIVEQHRGHISAANNPAPATGASVIISLPAP